MLYNENESLDYKNFPIEILVEMIISFLLVTFGSLFEYAKFEEIYFDKQNKEKMVGSFGKRLFNFNTSKGGMINRYLDKKQQ